MGAFIQENSMLELPIRSLSKRGNFTLVSVCIVFAFVVWDRKTEDYYSLYSWVFIIEIFCIFIVVFLKSECGFETLV